MSVPTLGADESQDGAAELVAAPSDAAPQAFRVLAVAAVCLGVAALAAATFVLSYSAIRAVALQAGITPRLAKDYPLLLDAMLVIVLAAILALRGSGLPSKLLAWVTLLLVMTVAAGADALHTAGRSLPHQAASITAAVLPFVLVLVAFALLLAMLRHVRLGRLAEPTDFVTGYGSAWALPQPANAQPAAAQPAAAQPAAAQPAAAQPTEVRSDPAADDPAADGYDDDIESVDDSEDPDDSEESSDFGMALASLTTEADETESMDDLDGPVFHRLFSAPAPEAQSED